MTISNGVLDVGDDNVAIKSWHVDETHPGGASEHIAIADCTSPREPGLPFATHEQFCSVM